MALYICRHMVYASSLITGTCTSYVASCAAAAGKVCSALTQLQGTKNNPPESLMNAIEVETVGSPRVLE